MGRDNTLLILAVGAVAIYLVSQSSRTSAYAAPSPSGTPISWWIAQSGDPRTLVQTLPSLVAPPGYRPASEYELAQAGHPDVGGATGGM
jgi:hypothetical protein